MSINNDVRLIGRLVKDVELKQAASGVKYAFITVACNTPYTDNQGVTKEIVDFIPMTLFKKTAENAAKYIGKGSQVLVTGSLKYGKRKVGGKDVWEMNLNVDRVKYLSSKKKEETKPEAEPVQGELQTADGAVVKT